MKPDTNAFLSKYLQFVRQKLNITTAEVAYKMDIPEQHYLEIEANIRQVDFDYLDCIIEALGISTLTYFSYIEEYLASRKV